MDHLSLFGQGVLQRMTASIFTYGSQGLGSPERFQTMLSAQFSSELFAGERMRRSLKERTTHMW